MKLRLSAVEKILFLSICFTMLLLITRVVYSNTGSYLFYAWNLFLAIIPLYFSRKLYSYDAIKWAALFLIAGWLLFFPNAPYLITDIFHFHQRGNVPLWYDLLLVLSASWNGLMAGFISLMQVDEFLSRFIAKKWQVFYISGFMFAASIGIYIGRFLRFNSWNVITKPRSLMRFGIEYIFIPQQHINAWAFSTICTVFLLFIYYTIKNLPARLTPGRQ